MSFILVRSCCCCCCCFSSEASTAGRILLAVPLIDRPIIYFLEAMPSVCNIDSLWREFFESLMLLLLPVPSLFCKNVEEEVTGCIACPVSAFNIVQYFVCTGAILPLH